MANHYLEIGLGGTDYLAIIVDDQTPTCWLLMVTDRLQVSDPGCNVTLCIKLDNLLKRGIVCTGYSAHPIVGGLPQVVGLPNEPLPRLRSTSLGVL
jgi:hypothetical protein